jgi:branched-chain amino acid aminotransferase
VTGTFGGVTPVREIDGRALRVPGEMTVRLRKLYARLKDAEAARAHG